MFPGIKGPGQDVPGSGQGPAEDLRQTAALSEEASSGMSSSDCPRRLVPFGLGGVRGGRVSGGNGADPGQRTGPGLRGPDQDGSAVVADGVVSDGDGPAVGLADRPGTAIGAGSSSGSDPDLAGKCPVGGRCGLRGLRPVSIASGPEPFLFDPGGGQCASAGRPAGPGGPDPGRPGLFVAAGKASSGAAGASVDQAGKGQPVTGLPGDQRSGRRPPAGPDGVGPVPDAMGRGTIFSKFQTNAGSAQDAKPFSAGGQTGIVLGDGRVSADGPDERRPHDGRGPGPAGVECGRGAADDPGCDDRDEAMATQGRPAGVAEKSGQGRLCANRLEKSPKLAAQEKRPAARIPQNPSGHREGKRLRPKEVMKKREWHEFTALHATRTAERRRD